MANNNNGTLSSSASLNLASLRSNSFKVTATGATFIQIAAPTVTPTTLTTLSTAGGAGTPSISGYRIFCTVPSWLKVGTAIQFTGKTSVAAGSVLLDTYQIVQNVATNGTYFDVPVRAPRNPLTAALTANVLTGSPVVRLIVHAQKIIFSTPSTNASDITITDGINASNTSDGWTQAIPANNAGYEITAPVGSKLNVEHFYFSGTSGQVLAIRFI